MSNHQPKILLKMNNYLQSILMYFENVAHPAAGKYANLKKRKRSGASSLNPNATPDSLNIRDLIKRQDGFRRNPAP
jgi:hypothetical protein